MLSTAQDRQICYLLEQLAAAEAIQRGLHQDTKFAGRMTPAMAGNEEQPDSADGEADAALRLQLTSTKAALEDERQVICSSPASEHASVGTFPDASYGCRIDKAMKINGGGQRLLQVHAEECQRLAIETAVARARASGAARSDLAAAAARAAEQAAREALAASQREAAEVYDRWRLRCVCICSRSILHVQLCLQASMGDRWAAAKAPDESTGRRTEAAEQQASAFQAQSERARAAEQAAVTQQRLQAAALDVVSRQLHETRQLAAWQERRIATLEGSDAHRSIARCSGGLQDCL